MNIKFYRCKVCGKIIAIVGGCSACPTVCCGQEMEELIPNTQDGAFDKHVLFTTSKIESSALMLARSITQ